MKKEKKGVRNRREKEERHVSVGQCHLEGGRGNYGTGGSPREGQSSATMRAGQGRGGVGGLGQDTAGRAAAAQSRDRPTFT